MTADAPTLSPELVARMRPVWEAAYEALRTDIGTLEDLAKAAARAAAARDERVAQGAVRPRVESMPPKRRYVKRTEPSVRAVSVRRAPSKTWSERRARTDEQRARATELRAAQRARMSDEQREARNRLLTERRHAAEAALTAAQLQARREARRAADRARIAALTPEEREARREAERARSAARHAALTPEQVAAKKARAHAAYLRKKGRTA